MATYNSPGVRAEELQRTITISPLASNFIVAVIAEVQPSTGFTEEFILTGLDEAKLAKKGVVASAVIVRSRDRGTVYEEGTHFTLVQSSSNVYTADTRFQRIQKSVTDETITFDAGRDHYVLANPKGIHDITVRTADPEKTYQEFRDYTVDAYSGTIYRLSDGTIPLGDDVLVSYKYGIESGEPLSVAYRYADEAYYSPQLFDSYSELSGQYGLPFVNGEENQMVLAGQMVFSNGSTQTQVLAVPVNPYSTDAENPDKTRPSLADWQQAVQTLEEFEMDAPLVVEASGNLNFQRSYLTPRIRDNQSYMRPRMCVLGLDGSSKTITKSELRAYATASNHQRIIVANGSRYETLDQFGGVQVVGGQYAGAAIAGMLTRGRVQDSITRQQVANLRTTKADKRSEMDTDTVAGLCVLENRQGFISVRHATTTAYADVNTREVNVIRQKDFLIKAMRDTLDRTVIGRLMEPDVDLIVSQICLQILENSKGDFVIADYTSPQVYQDPTNPTRIDVRFEYLPNYAVNEIRIQFALTPFGTVGAAT